MVRVSDETRVLGPLVSKDSAVPRFPDQCLLDTSCGLAFHAACLGPGGSCSDHLRATFGGPFGGRSDCAARGPFEREASLGLDARVVVLHRRPREFLEEGVQI